MTQDLPESETSSPTTLVSFARYLAIWTVIALFFSVQTYLGYQYSGEPIAWWRTLVVSLIEWYAWGLAFVYASRLTRRYPLSRPKLARAIAPHLGYMLMCAVVNFNVVRVISEGLAPFETTLVSFNGMLTKSAMVLVVAHALSYYRDSEDRTRRALRLEAELARARLQVLRMQLQPHFLFNTLHAIGTLMHRDVGAAEAMLTRLSDLLRLSLEHAEVQEISLEKEVELLRLYLDIQQKRFEDRLQVSYDVQPETLDAQVPSMILQPIVENAIRHGVTRRTGAERIAVGASRQGETLTLTVEDDGPGLLSDNGKIREGVGLANTRARLLELYGESQALWMRPAAEGGLRVVVELPFRVKDEDPRADR